MVLKNMRNGFKDHLYSFGKQNLILYGGLPAATVGTLSTAQSSNQIALTRLTVRVSSLSRTKVRLGGSQS